ncbi:hypothetical protein CLOM_g23657 [Closterium sp. NIES-68]|nr:hypothetical protein CLOM_g23657 [Closterium sp. NIES-68]GJP86876.1 hypothetical protein CLOP_g16850 [Closterium sp. NIES-67]
MAGVLKPTALFFVLGVILAVAQPGGMGPGAGGPGGPGGRGGCPLNLTVVGNLTGHVSAPLANCSSSASPSAPGAFFMDIFKNASGHYNLFFGALLLDVSGASPDSLVIVQGAPCDSSTAQLLSLQASAEKWVGHSGWWLLRAEAHLQGFVEDADATAVEAILTGVPNATLPDPPANSTMPFPPVGGIGQFPPNGRFNGTFAPNGTINGSFPFPPHMGPPSNGTFNGTLPPAFNRTVNGSFPPPLNGSFPPPLNGSLPPPPNGTSIAAPGSLPAPGALAPMMGRRLLGLFWPDSRGQEETVSASKAASGEDDGQDTDMFSSLAKATAALFSGSSDGTSPATVTAEAAAAAVSAAVNASGLAVLAVNSDSGTQWGGNLVGFLGGPGGPMGAMGAVGQP